LKIIPIFIPHSGCPYRCIYCDQHKISGTVKSPSPEEIKSIIERNLKTIPPGERVEVAFFGGTFTLLPENLQQKYLEITFPYVKNKKIAGIRMSTHPDAVTAKSMELFKKMGGCMVELGVQSMDKEVLKKANRAMDPGAVKKAAGIIKKSGLDLGVQVMLGLPGDTPAKSIKTAETLAELKPKTARIYPAIVLKGTMLGALFKKGRYRPLTMEEAIEWSACVCDIFEKRGVKVIRIGLHPSKELNSKTAILAGPYHINFGQMARAAQMRHKMMLAVVDPRMPAKAKMRLKKMGYRVTETPLHPRLAKPVQGHPDMMLFSRGKKVIYEPRLEKIAEILRYNGYECIKGETIKSSKYPKDIIYDACSLGKSIIRYDGRIEKHIENLKAKFIKVKQGYAKCSIVAIDDKYIITSDSSIKDAWGRKALLVRPGHVKLPGYKTGFIGGASGSHKDKIFFTGSLKTHPDGKSIREFIETRGKKIVELSSGPLCDAGTIFFF
jgi:radical SAM superfamily enzyme/signal recognition particle subunit SEC65